MESLSSTVTIESATPRRSATPTSLVEREFDLLNRVSRVKQGSDVISTMEFLGRSYRLASKGYQNGDLVKYLYDQGRYNGRGF